MYTIMGVTGQVGGSTAEYLLAQGKKVRAVVRNEQKAEYWKQKGAEVVVADYRDAAALEKAFEGSEGVFVLNPAVYYPEEGFPETRQFAAAVRTALEATKPGKFVVLSSVGAHQTSGLGVITSLNILEQELKQVAIPSAFIRAAWFMENSQWDVEPAKATGEIYAFLAPKDRQIPMVGIDDIGKVAAETLQQTWQGVRYIELEGPEKVSPDDIAAVLAKLLNREVKAVLAPRSEWEAIFVQQGGIADRVGSRVEMLEGFNSGWIDFERQGTEFITGSVTLEESLKKLLQP